MARKRLDLLKDGRKLILFGGKGGTGKTTCAAATGLYMAQAGKKTLVYSVNPAHCLSDSFGQTIGDRVTPIGGRDTLYGLEINANRLFEELKTTYRDTIDEVLGKMLKEGIDLPFESKVMRDAMNFTPPGVDELMALSKLSDIIKAREYDVIVIDTAAGAHTINLLSMPAQIYEWITMVLRLLDQYRAMMPMRRAKALMEDAKDDIEAMIEILSDPKQTAFVMVTIPEAMGTYVTEDMIAGLRSCGTECRDIVVNLCLPPGVECRYCLARRERQVTEIANVHKKFPDYNIVEVPLLPQEVKGEPGLMNFAKILFEGEYKTPSLTVDAPDMSPSSIAQTPRLAVREDIQLILFGGKGGCGKTTSSAATGIYMAERGKKTLVLSTDPQRSLSDSFDQTIGEEATAIQGIHNLYGVEIDTEKLMSEWLDQHKEAILDIAEAGTYFKKEDLAEFFELSLPGMDEFVALIRLVDLMKEDTYDLFILDTAPTGHTYRLLELPDFMSRWTKLMLEMRSKTQYIVRRFFGRGLKERADIFLQDLKNDIERVRTAFRGTHTEFIPVTILEEMAILESERLVGFLHQYLIPVRQIIINGFVPPNPRCPYCSAKRMSQGKHFGDVCKKFPDLKAVGMPLFPHEMRGIDDLKEFAQALYG